MIEKNAIRLRIQAWIYTLISLLAWSVVLFVISANDRKNLMERPVAILAVCSLTLSLIVTIIQLIRLIRMRKVEKSSGN